jgi:hypothetical protein
VRPITVVVEGTCDEIVVENLRKLIATELVEEVVVVGPPDGAEPPSQVRGVSVVAHRTRAPGSAESVAQLIGGVCTSHVLKLETSGELDPIPGALHRMVETAQSCSAAIVYGDYCDQIDDAVSAHPLPDYQPGSLSDRFPLGPMVLWDVDALARAAERHGAPRDLRWLTWYDLRLKVASISPVIRLQEPLALVTPVEQRTTGQAVFDYLTAGRKLQIEAEEVATEHLERLGAKLAGPFLPFVSEQPFPVEASIVIPVRDRERTVGDAVRSALAQETSFPFNVVVVDNHSTDGTSSILAEIADRDERLFHVVPERLDLGIGGCWNRAIFDGACGRYAVQLDSDDLYEGPTVLASMVSALRDGRCGMAIGSYSLVDMDLEPIPPGLIDHREWTPDNGPNNALRIEGLGAPRAFATELVRAHPFPNVSYGEDYAVALRICREYRVGRIYESLYHCRRWEDNTDANLSPAVAASHQTFKDRVRTVEMEARARANRLAPESRG